MSFDGKDPDLALRKTGPDQIAWLYNAIERVIEKDNHPSVSRQREMKIYACMYEIIDVLGLELDDKAIYNATPNDVRRL